MTLKVLRTLICPFCRKNLTLKHSYFKKNENLVHATLFCDCDTYPIVGGVLFLTKDRIKDKANLFLRQSSLPKTEEIPIFLFRLPFGNFLTVGIVSLAARIKIFKNLSFKNFMKAFIAIGIYEKKWGSYLLNRFESKSFLPAVIASSLVKKGSRVLDLASGAGHLLYILRTKTKEEEITAVETSLPGIYLAKKYFCPHANFIYADLENPLPFKNENFDSIFVNDAFHYISNKSGLGTEIVRTLKEEGFVSLNVLHNAKFKNSFVDPIHFPDTPSGYAFHFPGLKYSVFSEKNSTGEKLKYIERKKANGKLRELRTFTLILSKKEINKDINAEVESLIPGGDN